MIHFFKQSKLIQFNKEKTTFIGDVITQPGYYWCKAFDSETIRLSCLKQFGFPKITFEKSIPDKFPEMGILELKNAFIFGENGWIINEHGYWLPEFSWYGENYNEVSTDHKTGNFKKLKGTGLLLCSDWSYKNYCHFLLDAIGRYEIFRKAGYSIDDVDYIYCPGPNSNTKHLMEKLGIPIHKCIIPESEISFKFDRLIIPSFPGVRRVYPKWLVTFLKKEFTDISSIKDRRLYIPRSKSRKISNEYELIPILKKYNFEIFDPADHVNAPSFFSEASMVVGAHGAALANLAFCQPGTKVLELMPSDHIFPYYYSLSCAADLDYHLMIGKSEVERPEPKIGKSPYNFFIDVDMFENALSEILL
jgi:hypothetical protein